MVRPQHSQRKTDKITHIRESLFRWFSKHWKWFIETALIVAGVAFACCAWIESKRQADASVIQTIAYINYDWDSLAVNFQKYLLEIQVPFTNTGQTPATNLRGLAVIHYGYKDLDFIIDSVRLNNGIESSDLGARNHSRIEARRKFLVTDFSSKIVDSIVDVFTNNAPVFFYSHITYDDYTGVRRYSDFCIIMNGTMKPKFNFNIYKKYNSTGIVN